MALLNRLENSKLSLPGNKISAVPGYPNWGYYSSKQRSISNGNDRGFSNLHNQYSVYSLDDSENTTTMRILNFKGGQYIPTETRLDPLDNKAPKNTTGAATYINKNRSAGRNLKGIPGTYSSTGPLEGRY